MTKDDEQNNLDDSFSIINRIPESSIPENRPRTLPGKQNYPSPPNPRKKSESAHVPVREYSLMCFFFYFKYKYRLFSNYEIISFTN